MTDPAGTKAASAESVLPQATETPEDVVAAPPDEKDATIARLERDLAERGSELSAVKEAHLEAEAKLIEAGKALAQAVASYQAVVVGSNPDVPPELISGGTIGEVDASLRNARAIIDRVRQEIEAEASKTRVPAGAPRRAPLDLPVLSPREKIQYAIGGKK